MSKQWWQDLVHPEMVNRIRQESDERPVVIFKHSTRCSVSSVAFSRLMRAWDHSAMNNITMYMLDLISYRDISDRVESTFRVKHESPQLLLIRNGESVYNTSHLGISYSALKQAIEQYN